MGPVGGGGPGDGAAAHWAPGGLASAWSGRLTSDQLDLLREQLGVVAPAPGLSRIETQVLAALARAPRGLLSVLVARGLARRDRELAALGRAREVEVFHANVTAAQWPSLAPHLARVRLPKGRPPRTQRRRVPPELRHLFWNTAPSQLDLDRAGGSIARRLIQTGDLDGLAWGAEQLLREDWRHAARTRGLAPDLRALALNLAEASVD